MKKTTYLLATILGLLLSLQTVWGQDTIAYDKNKISIETELNFAFTNKRGIESKNGTIYYVEKDKKTITAYENGKVKWKTNIIDISGQPTVGLPEIRYIRIYHDKLKVVFGKHNFVEVDINNGKITNSGSD